MNADNEWMADALCTPGPWWTSDHRPPVNLMVSLRQVCDRCPVQSDCARHALTTDAHSGVYAGIWLPGRHGPRWQAARHALRLMMATHRKGIA